MLIPILIHTLYDFCTTFFLWLDSSKNLKKRIQVEELKLDNVSESNKKMEGSVEPFDADEASIRALFGLLDVDHNGTIDQKEWSLGLRLLG
jgi:hypothetical protein